MIEKPGHALIKADCVECGFTTARATRAEVLLAADAWGKTLPRVDIRVPIRPPPLSLYADSAFRCPVCDTHHSGMALTGAGSECDCGAVFVNADLLAGEDTIGLLKKAVVAVFLISICVAMGIALL